MLLGIRPWGFCIMRKLRFEYLPLDKIDVSLLNVRKSNVRATYLPIWYHPGFKCLSVSPIFFWSNEKVLSFINKNGIPKNIHHSLGTSTECWCGAYKRKSDFVELHRMNPEMFKKLMKAEEKNRSGFTFLYKDGKKIPLKSLIPNKK